jgi:predicted dinucleotide-binding enzyme
MQTLGIIGSGNIGAAIARLAVKSGLNVVLANSRGPETLRHLIAELGPLATAGTVEHAASTADVIILSVPLPAVQNIPAEWLGGKVVLDTSNYYPSREWPHRGTRHRDPDHQRSGAQMARWGSPWTGSPAPGRPACLGSNPHSQRHSGGVHQGTAGLHR